jgi:hypothetical protein
LTAALDHEKAQNQNHEDHILELNEAKDESEKRLAELTTLLDQAKGQNRNQDIHGIEQQQPCHVVS